jgi:hypothetical protein
MWTDALGLTARGEPQPRLDPPAASPALVPCRTLGEYITALVERLGEQEPWRLARLREVVGARRARIGLDAESVDVWFEGEVLIVRDSPAGPVDGEGSTDRLTTFELLAGRLEVKDAILQGRLHAHGDTESLVRIFQAIEILLDGASRTPALQQLAADYLSDPCRPSPPPVPPPSPAWRVQVDPDRLPGYERVMLQRLDLLA